MGQPGTGNPMPQMGAPGGGVRPNMPPGAMAPGGVRPPVMQGSNPNTGNLFGGGDPLAKK